MWSAIETPPIETSWWVLLIIFVVIAAGTFVQSIVGLGLGLVAAPVVTLLAPELMPGGLLMICLLLPFITLSKEHHDIDWSGVSWALGARVLGTAVGVAIVASVSAGTLDIIVGTVVLAAVLLTLRAVEIPINRGTLSAAGFTAGITGTASSIGGPPMALLYQRRPPHQIRSTLAIFFIAGAFFSLIGLGLAGELTAAEAWVALLMVPAQILGFAASGPMRRRLDADAVRTGVLTVCAASAVVLIVRSLFG